MVLLILLLVDQLSNLIDLFLLIVDFGLNLIEVLILGLVVLADLAVLSLQFEDVSLCDVDLVLKVSDFVLQSLEVLLLDSRCLILSVLQSILH